MENEIECREQKKVLPTSNGQEEVAVAAYKMAYIASTYSFLSLMMIMNVHEHVKSSSIHASINRRHQNERFRRNLLPLTQTKFILWSFR